MLNEKLLSFEYFTYLIVEEYYKTGRISDNHKVKDLSILKIMKLLFLTVVASYDNSEDVGYLSKIFNSFWAYPFGPVEIEINRNRYLTINYKYDK